MRPTVRRAFYEFTARFEGVVPHFYRDVKNLVTIGVGNLVDPIELAMGLPLVHEGGYVAVPSEIVAEWDIIKRAPGLDRSGWRAAAKLCKLHLTPEGIRELVLAKLDHNDAYLAKRFVDYETWPADAQLALLSMAWACGPAFHFPMFEVAVQARKFDIAALECHMDDAHNPDLVPRNKANKVLFRNAARVLRDSLWLDTLYYPTDLNAAERHDTPVMIPIPFPAVDTGETTFVSNLTEAVETDIVELKNREPKE